MSLILNLETSSTNCSVALANKGTTVAYKDLNEGFSHSENLMLFIEDVLKQASIKLEGIDAVAISSGPGSYTGLRIGVSAAKGFCFGLKVPLIAVNSLLVLTEAVYKLQKHDSETMFLPLFDARRMEVYSAVFDASGNIIETTAATIIDEHSFENLKSNHDVFYFGDGANKCEPYFLRFENFKFIEGIIPSAQHMAGISYQKYLNKEFEDVAYFQPNYLKEFHTTAKIKEV